MIERSDADSSKQPLEQQGQMLETTLENWQGEEARTDDILVMGVKL